MLYDVSTTYDLETVRQFQRILNGTIRSKKIKVISIISLVVSIACFAYAVLWMIARFVWIPVLFGLVFGVVFLLLALNYKKIANRSGKSLVGNPPVTERYIFDKDGYRTKTSGKTLSSKYNIIDAICENENFYVLMIGHNRGFLLDKRQFKKGTPEDFQSFITEITGKSIQTA